MKKSELVALIKPANTSAAVTESILDALGSVVQEQLARGGEVTLPGIGKLSVTERAARAGRNPRTGEIIPIEAKKTPKFSAAKALKDAVNG
ncbi:HU family DNA-binding protein [Methylobacillus flagellatus]|uniref:Histone-like DNA-binding protein n=1 Tax=Methylobacillus flagellatus (strain ATCC 51484 / DSM 6875 / VKM B-1610 / KT) TaxID=265072 RepID=Q1GXQ0_METFK|nr:HU family DNA-binding protein [Methylobacillus flagellatus]ABE50987.1 histone-like DNA-binding protein [Methylobacillus flagellatus KT]